MIDNVQNEPVKSGKNVIMGLVLLLVFMVTVACMCPVYMQNSINRLYGNYYGLREKSSLLKREILLKDFEINMLTSINHLAKFAEKTGLGLNEVPVKIMITEGSHE